MTPADPGKGGDPFDVWARPAAAPSTTPSTTPPPPQPPRLGPERTAFDGSFVGPLVPPPPLPAGPPAPPAPPAAPPVPDVILNLPLGTGRLIAMALDLLTRQDSGLRGPSFYIGFLLLISAGPVVALVAIGYLALGDRAFAPGSPVGALIGWTLLAGIPASLGYFAVSIEAQALATAVIGGRAEGRPLRLRESIAIARRRFWAVVGGQLVAGIAGLIGGTIAGFVTDTLIGPVDAIDYGVKLVVGVLVGAPFVYITAGIVLGEVGVGEAIQRSLRLFAARKRLALVVSAFSALSQFIVLFGLGIALDTTDRLGGAAGLLDRVPAPVAVLVVAALVFALGTLTFLVAAIAAAPAVYGFAALTHYTHGLERGRLAPLRVRRLWDPWLTPAMALGAIVALVSLVFGVLALPG